MSYTGQNARFTTVGLRPLSADPSSPFPGQMFYSDGTFRAAGVWVWDGADWVIIGAGSPPPPPPGAGKAVILGGAVSTTSQNTIQTVTISTLGNATLFGNLADPRRYIGATASTTRSIFLGGDFNFDSTIYSTLEYITFASESNSAFFGNALGPVTGSAGCGNNVRSIFAGGSSSYGTSLNTVQYVAPSTLGNSISFGDVAGPGEVRVYMGALSSPTRGVWAGGKNNSSPFPTTTDQIQYVEIATLGNGLTFGSLLAPTLTDFNAAGCSNAIAGYFCTSGSAIQRIVIATLANAVSFSGGGGSVFAASNSTRAVCKLTGAMEIGFFELVTIGSVMST